MRVLGKLLTAGLLVLVAFVVYAWRPAIEAAEPPAVDSFSDAVIERGRQLAGAGNCATCHTLPGGADYAGGYPIDTGFGIVYSTNISPHPEQGIGRWSEAAFARAMREGVGRDGAHLFPAFPYTHYAAVTDADIAALYAYFMTRDPATAVIPDNTLPFPLNLRMLQAGWKLLFFDGQPFEPVPERDEVWNRGAYLAEGLGHCGACHTPRNALGAERGDAGYAGAVVDGWYAPALDAGNAAPLAWTEAELFDYLRSGASALHGVAAGSMSEVVHDGLARLPDADVRALARYFAALGEAPDAVAEADVRAAMAGAAAEPGDHGAALYSAACEACHYNRPGAPLAARPELSLNSAVHAPEPDNLLRLTLQGIDRPAGDPGLYMHGYAGALSDADVAAIADYLRRRYAGAAPAGDGWQNLEARVGQIRQGMEAGE